MFNIYLNFPYLHLLTIYWGTATTLSYNICSLGNVLWLKIDLDFQAKNCRVASTDHFSTAACCDVFNIETVEHGDYIIAVALHFAILRLCTHLYILIWPIVKVWKWNVSFPVSVNIMFIFSAEDWGNHFNVPRRSQASCNNPGVGCRPEATRLASHLCNEQGTVIPSITWFSSHSVLPVKLN